MPSIRLGAALLSYAIVVAAHPAAPAPPAPTSPDVLAVAAPAEPTAEAAPRWRSLGDAYWEGAAWTAQAEKRRRRAASEVIPALEEAVRCWRTAGAPLEEAEAQATLGSLLNDGGRHHDALGRFEEALAIARRVGVPRLEARSLNGVGESRALLGEMQEAFDAFNELLVLQRRLGDAAGELEALGNLGYVYLRLGDYVEASDLFERALKTARRIGARSFEATLLNNLGQALLEQGDLEGARARYEAALELRREGDDQRAYALVNLGGVYRASGDARRAIALFETALASFRSAGNRPAEATVLDNLGWAHVDLGQADRAYELHAQALALRETTGDLNQVMSLHFAARAEMQRGRPEEARLLFERALSLVEAKRDRVVTRRLRTSMLAPLRVVYEGYADALQQLHRGRPEAGLDRLAFEVSERARARSLLELLADEKGGPLTEDPAERWARPLTVEELRSRALDPDTVVLAYLLGEQRSHVWALTADALVSHELPSRARLTDLARRAHDLISTRPGRRPPARRGAGELEQVLGELSRILLAPVAAQLDAPRIAVVADGPLHYVPFAALPTPGEGSAPLLAGHEVVTLPSVSTLALLREAATQQPPPRKEIAVFADPVFDARDERVRSGKAGAPAAGSPPSRLVRPSPLNSSVRDVDGDRGGFGRLPFTRREALGILALARPRASRGALDFDANLQAVRAPELADYRYVHFATHGLLNNARPELSGLVLTLTDRDGRPRDGFLSVEEILKLRWRAELVTLSGCRTGLGRSVGGEGLVGVTRAFMVAGAPRVVASLWSVDDMATAELMKRFYAEMLGPEARSPAAALRAAQLSLRGTGGWAAPYYWAAFQLHGDWR